MCKNKTSSRGLLSAYLLRFGEGNRGDPGKAGGTLFSRTERVTFEFLSLNIPVRRSFVHRASMRAIGGEKGHG